MKKTACLAFFALAGSAVFANTASLTGKNGVGAFIGPFSWIINGDVPGPVIISNPVSHPMQVMIYNSTDAPANPIYVTGCLPNELAVQTVMAGGNLACFTTTTVTWELHLPDTDGATGTYFIDNIQNQTKMDYQFAK